MIILAGVNKEGVIDFRYMVRKFGRDNDYHVAGSQVLGKGGAVNSLIEAAKGIHHAVDNSDDGISVYFSSDFPPEAREVIGRALVKVSESVAS